MYTVTIILLVPNGRGFDYQHIPHIMYQSHWFVYHQQPQLLVLANACAMADNLYHYYSWS